MSGGACFANGWDGKPAGQPGLARYYSEAIVDGTAICKKDDSFFGGAAPLPLGAGYGIVLGFGLFFSFFTTGLVYLDMKYGGTKISSEFFNTAGRTVKTGLTAAVIVSQWTWAATLLQSSNVAFQYGVSGPFWYASGATIQVLLFGILAIEVKRKAYTAHTIAEIIDARWGETAHKVFIYFAFLTNIIVSAMLVLGGAATVEALTGMHKAVASFLIPIGVISYTMAGGLKATFMASYLHTAVIFVVLCIFMFIVYTSDDTLGSSDKVYEALQAVASKDRNCFTADKPGPNGEIVVNDGQNCGPVADNRGGSYLTMLSEGGFIFGIINIVGNFGTVFVDQSYWQSAIAAKPSSSTKGYLLGGLVWFTIPFTLATAMGLACVALDLPVTGNEAGSGLVPPASAVHFMGKGGGVMVTIMLFMAITSTGSAEQIAVSSLCAYDIYRKYFNPEATGADIVRVSRFVIFGFGIFMGVLSIGLNAINESEPAFGLGFVYLMMGIFIGSAVIPVSLVLTWKDANASGAVAGAFGGQIMGIIVWIIVASTEPEGEISVATMGKNYPMLFGNITAILGGGLIHIVMSLMNPQDFNFDELAGKIKLIDDKLPELEPEESDPKLLEGAKGWIMKWGFGFTFVMVILWPALSLPAGCGSSGECGVFSKGYFAMWVAIAMIWGIVATLVITILPIYESMADIMAVVNGMMSGEAVDSKDVEKQFDAI
ncbi:urea-proton symporter [Pycnococcus provasolii]